MTGKDNFVIQNNQTDFLFCPKTYAKSVRVNNRFILETYHCKEQSFIYMNFRPFHYDDLGPWFQIHILSVYSASVCYLSINKPVVDVSRF